MALIDRFCDLRHIASAQIEATISAHMKAAVYTKARLGKVLEMKDLEQPLPKDNEVLIRVRAASVNPLDWRMKSVVCQTSGIESGSRSINFGPALHY